LNVHVATPAVRGTFTQIGTIPFEKSTKPVGVPSPGATAPTVALTVTGSPKDEGLSEDVTIVVVDDWFTPWVMVGEVEEL
jgi:hypothetical protein